MLSLFFSKSLISIIRILRSSIFVLTAFSKMSSIKTPREKVRISTLSGSIPKEKTCSLVKSDAAISSVLNFKLLKALRIFSPLRRVGRTSISISEVVLVHHNKRPHDRPLIQTRHCNKLSQHTFVHFAEKAHELTSRLVTVNPSSVKLS